MLFIVCGWVGFQEQAILLLFTYASIYDNVVKRNKTEIGFFKYYRDKIILNTYYVLNGPILSH